MMRPLLLLSLVGFVSLTLAQTSPPTTTKAASTTTPNPVDVKATDAAKKKYDEAKAAEKKAFEDYENALEDSKSCQEKLAAAKKRNDVVAPVQAKLTAMKTGGAEALKTCAAKEADNLSKDDGVVGKEAKAATEELKKLEDPADKTKGECPTSITTQDTMKKAYDDAKKKTNDEKAKFEEKAKKAPPSAGAPGAKPTMTKEQQASVEAHEKAREANDEYAAAFKEINECPGAIADLEAKSKFAKDWKAAVEKLLADTAKQADCAAPEGTADNTKNDKAAIEPWKSPAETMATEAEKPIEEKKSDCKTKEEGLKSLKDAAEKAQKEADYAQKVANDPSLATTGAPTTAKPTTAKGASDASGATTAAPGGAGGSSDKQDEGPNATKNVDGVPLTPSSPCCQKAAAGLCKVSVLVRNACNTECGCERAKGTCTGEAPKACKTAGEAAPPAPPGKPCDDKSPKCDAWANNGFCDAKKGYWMQNNCRKSCNLCDCNQGDIDDFHCWFWATIGECSKNSGWMLKYCGLSCDCKAEGPTTSASMAQRRKIAARAAKARTLQRIKAYRSALLAKIKRRRAKARRGLGKKAASRRLLKARAQRRRRLRVAKLQN